jgi:hypothetical protein
MPNDNSTSITLKSAKLSVNHDAKDRQPGFLRAEKSFHQYVAPAYADSPILCVVSVDGQTHRQPEQAPNR